MHASSAGLRRSSHQMEVAAPARQLYDLVADAAAGPLVFPGTVHVEWLNRTAAEETLRIWAVNGTTARRWTSRRLLDPAGLSVTFRQERPEPPVEFMQGRWQMNPMAPARTLVTLSHAYRAVGDEPAALAWIEDFVDRVSQGQLRALREFAASGAPVVVEETADLDCPVETAYALVEDCGAWGATDGPARPAVTRWLLPDLQLADLMVTASDGGTRACQLAWVCFPGSHIAFKDMLPASPVAAHIGCLRFSGIPEGTRVEARELVVTSRDGSAPGEVPEGATISGVLLARLKALG
jgi:aromatase